MAKTAKVRLAKRTANCPACGAKVEFRVGTSLVTVCDFCQSAVARTDRGVEDHGKVADLAETASPLALGQKGKWQGKTLRLVGRVQYRHFAGGVWDEWYVALANGKWGWLAEAQGQFYLTLHRKLSDASAIPPIDDLTPGQTITLGEIGEFTVNETGTAAFHAAEGELPFDPSKITLHRYADLSGPNGAFATFDYSDSPPAVYTGQKVTLDELEIQGLSREAVDTAVGALQLNCPQCGGTLPLHAPDSAQRTTCPSCRSLFAVASGKLSYLQTLQPPKPALVIPLGTVGKLKDVDWTVIGYLRRYVTYDKRYYWAEYLLYHPREGYRWLVHSDDHWSFVSPLQPGDVKVSGDRATWSGRSFRLFQSTIVTVSQVYGEFYWDVKAGEEVHGKDFVNAPYMISVETSDPRLTGAEGKEINISLGEYLPHAELEQAFGLKNVRRGWGVAPNQPCPVGNEVYGYWLVFVVFIAAAWGLLSNMRASGVDTALGVWALILVSLQPLGTMIYKSSFEVSRWKDSEFNPYASSDE